MRPEKTPGSLSDTSAGNARKLAAVLTLAVILGIAIGAAGTAIYGSVRFSDDPVVANVRQPATPGYSAEATPAEKILPTADIPALITKMRQRDSAAAVQPTYTPRPPPTRSSTRPAPTRSNDRPRPAPTPELAGTPEPTYTATIADWLPVTTNTNWARDEHPGFYWAVAELPWAVDGVDLSEERAVNDLMYLAVTDVAIAKRVVDMPFLETLEDADRHAINAIHAIAHRGHGRALRTSALFQEGVTDAWTPVIAAAGTAQDAVNVERFLDVNLVTLEQDQVPTEHGKVTIAIVRLQGNAEQSRTMELVKQAIQSTANVTGMQLPTNHVTLAVDQSTVAHGYDGLNHGFAISVNAEDTDTPAASMFNLLAHEVAHYWWRSNDNWVDEGMASIIAVDAAEASGYAVMESHAQQQGCAAAHLSEVDARQGEAEFHCNYFLGEQLFRALHDGMASGDFYQSAADLYRYTEAIKRNHPTAQQIAGVEELQQFFEEQASLIAQHYAGSENTPALLDPRQTAQ